MTDNATSLGITVQIAGGKEGFVLALVDPTLSLDANGSSGASANNYQTTFTEKGAAVSIADTDTSAVEPGGTAASAKVVLTNAQAGDVLGVSGTLPSGITSTTDTSVPGQVTVTLSGAASLASYQTAIEDLTFANTSSNPSTVDRTINVTYNDGGQDSNTAVSTIHVVAVNDAPVETVPGAQSTNKDTALSISGLSVSDVDANGGTETVTLSVSDGTISLASKTGLTFSSGTGSNDTSESFTGTLSAINNAIGTVRYQPTVGFSGSDTLNFSTNDNGNTGSGGAMTASRTVAIAVNNVNPTAKGTIQNQTYDDGQANVSIATSQAFSDSLGLTLTYSATGLPTGLTINAMTGQITGTVDHDASTNAPSKTGSGATLDGTYTIVETASDGQGGSTTQSFTINSKNQAPALGTKTANQTNSDGNAVSVNAAAAFSDPNGDPLTYAATGLPAGLTISSAGTISGTVAKNAQPGTYMVTVTATDDKGAATPEAFTWTINDVPPARTGTLANQSYDDGQGGIAIATSQGFTDANGNALTYSATGLPAGLTINATTGQITGTIDHDASKNAPTTTGSGATLDGTYAVVVTASDGLGGSTTQSFTIDSKNQAPTLGTKTVNQTNSDGDAVSVNAAAAFSDPNGDPLTYAATGLPPGLTISSAGMISGTVAKNAQPGSYSVTVTATDDKGAATPETFTWTINDVPPARTGTLANQSYDDGQGGIAIATSQGFTDANGNALTYSATGLPAGLTVNPTTGQITGTIDHDASKNAPTTTGSGATLDGTYAVVVTASDGQGGSATQSFMINSANGAPVVGVATAAQSSTTGQTVTPVDTSKAFSDPNGDPLTYSASNLPKGLSIDPATGIISGTVAANAASGSYVVRVLATDDKGAATRELVTWTISDAPPTANGTLANESYADATANIAIATSGAFASPNGLALSYTASGLPKGLSIDPATGLITGQLDHDASKNAPTTSGAGATLDGTYTVVVTASDGQGGTAQQVFKIDATNNAPTLVAQTPDQTGADGQQVSLDGAKPFNDRNTGDTFTYAASGLPTGLTIDPNTGLVSGTIDPHASRNGPFTVTVTITDDKGAATSETFRWGVNDVAPVATPALPDRSVDDGTAVSVATAGGFTNPNEVPYTYTATGLPKGLSIDPSTGIISGTIDHDASAHGTGGSYAIAVTANDGQGGTATNSFHLVSSNQAPVVGTKTADQTSTEGATIAGVDASKAFSDPNIGDIVTYTASNLPPGLTIDPKTGIISGTIPGNATPGAYAVTVTATDDKGAATPESLVWSIDNVPPVATGTLANQTFKDSTAGIAISTAGGFTDAVNNPLLYSATGLPAGLSIDQKTGQITGTLDHDASAHGQTESGSGATLDGTYTIVVTARDALGGSATQSFTLDAKNDAPVTGTTTTPMQTNTEGDAVSINTGIVFSDPNLGDVLTFSATALPPGLAIDPKSGLISGTIASGDYAQSPYQVVVTATDEKGASAQETFSFVTLPLPVMTVSVIPNYSGFDGTAASIDTASHFAGSSDATTTYSVSGLPSGLSINVTTGRITGTLDHDASAHGTTETGSGATLDGQYDVTVTAKNAGGAASQSFVLDVANQAPVVGTKTVDQTATTGQAIAALDASQAFSDPNGDPLTYAATGLPTGLSIDSATGKITGTIAATAPGVYAVSVTATDDKGAATIESFAWTVSDTPPTTKGTLAGQSYPDSTAGIAIDTAGGFTSPNGVPLTYRAAGLPAGLSIDPATGTITGQLDHEASATAPARSGSGATLDGTYTVTVTADDGQGGTAVQTFTIDATNNAPAIVGNTPDQHGQDGQAVSLDARQAFADPNSGDVLTFSATNLPQGLSIDPATGLISGTLADTASRAGPYSVQVTATDDKGAATTETFRWVVDDLAPQATPPLADRSINDGTAVSYATSGGFTNPNGVALAYSATGLPSGLAIDPATGLISGTLNHDASSAVPGGLYTVAVSVDDGQGGTATNIFHLTASNQAPIVATPIPDRTNNDGDTVTPIDASKVFTDPNPGDTLTYAASNLPKGLAIDPNTGVISGTIAGDAAPGGYYVTVTATDDKGAATPATFTWGIGDVPPTVTGTLPGQHVTDSQAGIDIATAGGFTSSSGLPLTYAATGLPRGLSIDPDTGAITGFIGHNASLDAPKTTGAGATLDGTYTVTITASDGQGGTATQSFTIDSTNQAPTLGLPTADQHAADGQPVSIDAGKSFADPNTGDTLQFGASGLPAGLAIDPASGLITGTIDAHASASGPYTVTVTATDNKGAATSETFAFAVDEVPPTAGAPVAAASSPDGTAIAPIDTASHFVSPNGLPLTYAATGLPAGLSIDPTSGRITGTLDHDASKNAPSTSGAGATLDGTYTVTISASDGQGGVATQNFTIDAVNEAPAIAAQTPDQHATDGQTVSLDTSKAFADPNVGDIVTYAADGLPAGLSIDPASGRITGTIASNAAVQGSYAVTVTATDDKGAATTETFAWTVTNVPPTAKGTLANQDAGDGAAGIAIDTAAAFADTNGNALTYAATGLPAGLSIDPTSGRITGTLDHDASKNAPVVSGSGATLDGTYTVDVTASDGLGGSATQSFAFDARNAAPIVGSKTADQTNRDGDAIAPVDASQAFSDPNGDPLTYAAANLPAGLSIDPVTGRITGAVAGSARPGSYRVAVTATDDKGAATTETFAWTIADVPPTAGAPIDVGTVPDGTTIAPFDTSASFGNPNGIPLTYTASGLPAGLAIDPTTGIVTGTLDHDASTGGDHGTYTVTVTASDGQGGAATQVYTLEAINQAPALVAPTADQAAAQGQAVAPVDASQAFADPNSGDVVRYAASGLPKGLAIDPASGLISGTIAPDATPADYVVTVIATDDKGAATAETFHWSVGEVLPVADGTLPPQRYGDGQGGIAIATAGGFASANGLPLAYDASGRGLPAGLSIDPATGLITGTLDRNASALAPVKLGAGASLEGIYAVTVTATDPFGGTTSQVFAIEVDDVPPMIGTRTPDQHGRAGQAIGPLDTGSAFVDASGDALTFAATGLPPGLAFDPATGRVTGVIDPTLASSGVYTVTVTATDEKGASVAESFLYTVDAVAPSILTPPSFFEPAAALLPNILGAAPARDLGPNRSVEPATPILDVINQTSGDAERSQVIALDGIVVSTVNGIAPLNGLERLSLPGEGIVRSGAGTNETGDHIARSESGIGRGVEALSTPLNFLGATSIDVDAASRGVTGPTINIETMLRDRVLSISVGSGAGLGDPLARVTVTLADGRPLPAWLRADGKGYLVGKVPGGVESIDLAITSTFASGATSHRSVTIRTDRGTITPLAPRPQAGRTLSHMVAASRAASADVSRIARLLD